MQQTLEILKQYYEQINYAGKYYGLFLLALLAYYALYLHEQKMNKASKINKASEINKASTIDKMSKAQPYRSQLGSDGKLLVMFAAVLGALLLLPPVVHVLIPFYTWSYGYWHMMMLLPVAIVVAYLYTLLAHLETRQKARRFLMLALVLLTALAGSVLPYSQATWRLETLSEKKEYEEIYEILVARSEQEQVVLAGSQEVLEEMRMLGSKVNLVYGRDMWNATLAREIPFEGATRYDDTVTYFYQLIEIATKDEITGNGAEAVEAMEMATDVGCNTMVYPNDTLQSQSILPEGWELLTQTDNYSIYVS